jgi:3-deoxy-D-manno-octulosonic-acid transferase
LAETLPPAQVVLTSTTRSGLERLRSLRPDLPSFLLPWDHPATLARFLERRRVRAAVFLEAEAWPWTLSVLASTSRPAAFAALRCGPASRRRWLRFHRAFPGLLETTIAWADGPAERALDLGFGEVRSGASLKWARVPRTIPPRIHPERIALLSLHARDVPAVARLVRSHPGHAWLWFPRRLALVPVLRLLARALGLVSVSNQVEPTPGQVWIAPRFGLVPERLPGCQAAWVSPGHDREEPLRLGVPLLLAGAFPTIEPDHPGPEETLEQVRSWLLAALQATESRSEASGWAESATRG